MAKIFGDVLVLGQSISALVAAAMLAKRGVRVVHAMPAKDTEMVHPYHLWPSIDDQTTASVIDELELNLPLMQAFNRHSGFSLIEEYNQCLNCYGFNSPQGHDIYRVFKYRSEPFIDTINALDMYYLEREMKLKSRVRYKNSLVDKISAWILQRKLKPIKKDFETRLSYLKSTDPWQLLLPKWFLGGDSEGALLVTALMLKHGLTKPKDLRLTPAQALVQLLRGALKKYGAHLIDDVVVERINQERNFIQGVISQRQELLVAKQYIYEHISVPTACYFTAFVNKKDVPVTFIDTGFFYCVTRAGIVSYYYHFIPTSKQEITTIVPTTAETSPELRLVLCGSSQTAPLAMIYEEAARLANEHFNVPLNSLKIVDNARSKTNTYQEASNGWLIDGSVPPYAQIPGEVATGKSMYKSVARKLGLKLYY